MKRQLLALFIIFLAKPTFGSEIFCLINHEGKDYPINYKQKGADYLAEYRDKQIKMDVLSENDWMVILAPNGKNKPTFHILYKSRKFDSKILKKTDNGVTTWRGACIRTPF